MFSCEYCGEVVPFEEYGILSDREEYEADNAFADTGVFIIHKGCKAKFESEVIGETEHLYLVREIGDKNGK